MNTMRFLGFLKKNLLVIILLAFVLVAPVLSLAQQNVPPAIDPPTRIINPINSDNLAGLVKTILEGILKIGIPVIALAIIYSGFLFVAAQGNPEKISDARRSLMYTLIGAAILLGSWAIAQLITETVRAL
jgi:hypothetical protein